MLFYWMLFCCMLISPSCLFAVCFSAECLCAVCFSAECFSADCFFVAQPFYAPRRSWANIARLGVMPMNMKVTPWQSRLCHFMRGHSRLSAWIGQDCKQVRQTKEDQAQEGKTCGNRSLWRGGDWYLMNWFSNASGLLHYNPLGGQRQSFIVTIMATSNSYNIINSVRSV